MTDAEQDSLQAIVGALREKAMRARVASTRGDDRLALFLTALAVDYDYFGDAVQHVLDGGDVRLKVPEQIQ